MDVATYPKAVVDVYTKFLKDAGELSAAEDGSPSTTTTDIQFEPSICEHCALEFNPQDSITMRSDGSIKACQHWHL